MPKAAKNAGTPLEGGEGSEPKKAKAAKNAGEAADVVSFEEWECKVIPKTVGEMTTFEYEKLKLRRPSVKIKEEEATILNEGVLNGKNTLVMMYFKPE